MRQAREMVPEADLETRKSLAQDIAADLEAALEQFREIVNGLEE